MSWVVRVWGPHTGSKEHTPFPVAYDQFVVGKKKHIRRKEDGLLQFKTIPHSRIVHERTYEFPSAKVYYLPGQVSRYVMYRRKEGTP